MSRTWITVVAVLAATSAAAQQDSSLAQLTVFPVIQAQRLPEFPFASWQNNTFGTVVVRYVIDTSGRADPSTIQFVSAPDSFMARAVRKSIRDSRFQPGIAGGGAVVVRVEQEFAFTTPRGRASTSGLRRVGTAALDSALWAQAAEVPPVPIFSPTLVLPSGMRVKGRLLVRFMIDTAGRVDPGSIHVLNSTDERLIAAAREAVIRARYRPAMVHGKPVRIVVEQPYDFESRP